MTATIKSALLPERDRELRRWLFCGVIVLCFHAAMLLWLMHRHDISPLGAPPAAVLVDLPAMDVAPASEVPPEAVEGPQLTEAQPEEVGTPQAQAIPELPPAQKPVAVLPPKPKPIPKKKVHPNPVLKRAQEPPARQTSAPKHSAAARGQLSAAARRGPAGSATSTASWRAAIYAHLLAHKPSGGGTTGTVTVSFSLSRAGRLLGAHLAGGAGSSVLAQRALGMVQGANPFPPAPADVAGGAFSFTVPVRFR